MPKKSPPTWVGVGFDRVLVQYEHWRGGQHIGEPIPEMVELVRGLLQNGVDVRIVTSRIHPLVHVSGSSPGNFATVQAVTPDASCKEATENAARIRQWCMEVFGQTLPITTQINPSMRTFYSDKAIQVESNTGVLVGAAHDNPSCGGQVNCGAEDPDECECCGPSDALPSRSLCCIVCFALGLLTSFGYSLLAAN